MRGRGQMKQVQHTRVASSLQLRRRGPPTPSDREGPLSRRPPSGSPDNGPFLAPQWSGQEVAHWSPGPVVPAGTELGEGIRLGSPVEVHVVNLLFVHVEPAERDVV